MEKWSGEEHRGRGERCPGSVCSYIWSGAPAFSVVERAAIADSNRDGLTRIVLEELHERKRVALRRSSHVP